MPGDEEEPADVTIEPTARRIALLTLAPSAGRLDTFGVLRPFAGLLAARPDRPSGPHGPPLAYLTLQPLVLEHLLERTHHESRTETIERNGPSTEAGATEGAPAAAETTTVREYLRERSAGADEDAGDGPVVDRGPDIPGAGDGSLSVRDPRQSLGGAPGRPARDAEGGPSVVARWRADRGRRPSRGPPPESMAERGVGTERTTLDASAPTREARPSATSGTPDQAGRPGLASDDTRPAARQRVAGGSDLVSADQPVAGLPADGDGGSTETPLTVAVPRPPDGDPPVSEVVGERTDRRPGPDQPRPRSEVGATSPASPPPAAADREAEGAVGDPMSALDDLDRPDLDRFVERLSDELARHDRIERERRGR